MTIEIPSTPAAVDADEQAAFEVMRTDAVLTGRAMSSGQFLAGAGQFLAGLIVAAELETVGRPEKLTADLFPDVDPAVVQEIWDRAVAVGFHAGRASVSSGRFTEDELARVRAKFEEAGFHAMGGLVARSGRLVARARRAPADGEIAREH
jgi:hypothetical protein